MSWVRQCSNCMVDFERIVGCNIMTCPKCFKKTCYACRKAVAGHNDPNHRACNRLAYAKNNRLHETELGKAEEKIKAELEEVEQEALADLFKPDTSRQFIHS